ncbi:MAG: Hsp33 family molecular chaperone HslO [Syntrophotaleaceae bacterium]
MRDHLVRVVTADGALRATAAITTNLVEAICSRQGTDATGTVALGRLVTGAALMGSLLKNDQRLVLMVEANGPLQKLHAETDSAGHIRGSVKNPVSGVPVGARGFDVPAAVGKAGFLHVIKDLGLKEPYRGMVMLYSSEIAEDLAYYLTTSEQVPSTVALGVFVEVDGRVSAAGGLLVQALPAGEESLVALLEQRLIALPPITALLREGKGPQEILEQLFTDIPLGKMEKTDLSFRCSCSREQIRRVLKALGPDELRDMIAEEEETFVTCEFCMEKYNFPRQELVELLHQLDSTR